MPRAYRHRIPGQVWHITGRCHRRQFLLKFARDRRRWVSWLYEARKRYGLCVLNYQVTSNDVHLVARDRGEGEIERAMQLIEGRTGQGYNRRKNRRGRVLGGQVSLDGGGYRRASGEVLAVRRSEHGACRCGRASGAVGRGRVPRDPTHEGTAPDRRSKCVERATRGRGASAREGVPRVGREPPGGWRAAAGATMERGDRCRAVEFRGASAGATRAEGALPEDRGDGWGLGAPGSACTVRVRFRCENGRRKREIGLEFGMKSRDYSWLRWSDPDNR